MLDELLAARKRRDEAFEVILTEGAKATKASLKVQAARAEFRLASDEVREIERDFAAYGPMIK